MRQVINGHTSHALRGLLLLNNFSQNHTFFADNRPTPYLASADADDKGRLSLLRRTADQSKAPPDAQVHTLSQHFHDADINSKRACFSRRRCSSPHGISDALEPCIPSSRLTCLKRQRAPNWQAPDSKK
eukprot:PhM_4_TR8746/c1_g4_i1/m.41217